MAVRADVSACRARFPIFERLVYINSCSQGALSDSVRAAYDEYLTGWDERGAPWDYWVERTEAARGVFARLVNAQPDDVAVTTSLSAGVSALASAIDFSVRPKVVISDYEFPTIGQIWHAQESRGARVVHVHEAEDGTIPPKHFRRVIDEETVKKVLDVLRDEVSEMPKNWNRRFKHNRDKIKTGDIYELAEVVRNLSLRESEKGLSTGEKQMFTRTKKILASELMYALDKDEEEAESYLDELLADSASQQLAVAGAK